MEWASFICETGPFHFGLGNALEVTCHKSELQCRKYYLIHLVIIRDKSQSNPPETCDDYTLH
ncbi:unnamed protein product, partial [Timema podura]|nr:unnamed protein product [Timema podura]